MNDSLLRLLADLPSAEPDALRAHRVRTRCHRALARRAPRPASSVARRLRGWNAVAAAFSVAYLTAAMHQALRLYGLL